MGAKAKAINQTLDAYQDLYRLLSEAYWKASTIQDKDRIRGIADAIYDLLTAVNAEEISGRTASFVALKVHVEAINLRIEALKADINKVIAVVKLSTEIAKAADKALGLATKILV